MAVLPQFLQCPAKGRWAVGISVLGAGSSSGRAVLYRALVPVRFVSSGQGAGGFKRRLKEKRYLCTENHTQRR